MILKIRDRNGWVIYDNVEKVRYQYYKYEDLKVQDYDEFWGSEEVKKKSPIVVIVYRRKYGTDKTVWFTNTVYLCNDNGKTIERIN